MGCATSMIKYLLFFFNFLFVVGGIVLIAFGALQISGYKEYKEILPEQLGVYMVAPILMMALGGIVLFISFMGCCGTVRESKCMMMTYAILLLVLLLAEIAIAVGIAVYKDDFKEFLKDGMQKSMLEYKDNKAVAESWDTTQSNLKCCGISSPTDWCTGTCIPESCCSEKESGCGNVFNLATSALLKSGKIYQEGCLDKIIDELKTNYGIYGASIVAAIEFLGVIFGCCLGLRFGRKRYST